MTTFDDRGHARTDTLQELLDGTLAREAEELVREHVHECARCRSELEGWALVFESLGEMATLEPGAGFEARVMEGLRPEASWAARLRARLRRLVPVPSVSSPSSHPDPTLVQDHVDGVLRGRSGRKLRDHLAGCPACAREAEAWQGLVGRLETLPRPLPSEGFAARVMEGVDRSRATATTAVSSAAASSGRDWRGLAAGVGRAAASLVPSTRKGWATLTGIALTPTVVLVTLVWAIASHPLVTLDRVGVFLGWKASRVAAAVWAGAVELAVESPILFRGWELLLDLASPTSAVVSGFVLATAMALSCWTLYRNLIGSRPTDASHVRISP